MTCATCQTGAISPNDYRKGLRRCVRCREQQPGTWFAGRKASPPSATAQISKSVAVASKRARPASSPAKANGESWWIGIDRQTLNAEAWKRFPGTVVDLVLNHKGQFGEVA